MLFWLELVSCEVFGVLGALAFLISFLFVLSARISLFSGGSVVSRLFSGFIPDFPLTPFLPFSNELKYL